MCITLKEEIKTLSEVKFMTKNKFEKLYTKIQKLKKLYKDNGIEYFTFSSTWSSAVKIAWLFKQNGCSLEGLIEINENIDDFETGKMRKTPAYLFKLN